MAMKTVVRITPALKKLRDQDLEIFEGKIPSNNQLDSFAEMLKPLLMIKQVSETLEGDKRPTMHLALPLIIKLGTISTSSKFKTSSKPTRAVIEAFELGLSGRMKDYGRSIPAYRLGNFLHPGFKGSLLNVLGNDYSYNATVEEIKSLFPEVRPEEQTLESQVS